MNCLWTTRWSWIYVNTCNLTINSMLPIFHSHNTDTAILNICQAISVDPPVQSSPPSHTHTHTPTPHHSPPPALPRGWGIECLLWGQTPPVYLCYHRAIMMTSSNGNIFRVTGPLCWEFTGPGEFPAQRPVTWSFDVFFDLRPNKRLSKQPWGWWFETPS